MKLERRSVRSTYLHRHHSTHRYYEMQMLCYPLQAGINHPPHYCRPRLPPLTLFHDNSPFSRSEFHCIINTIRDSSSWSWYFSSSVWEGQLEDSRTSGKNKIVLCLASHREYLGIIEKFSRLIIHSDNKQISSSIYWPIEEISGIIACKKTSTKTRSDYYFFY